MINQAPSFASRLILWQAKFGRHELPWQGTRDPYRVWLSEIMLQQTQVATVIDYFQRFVARFPTLQQLAQAPVDEVMACWSGLGYYARARNLHACAREIVAAHAGVFPRDAHAIAALPGIGRSTANAIAVFCFAERAAILDGNVKRVLCRHFAVEGYPGAAATERQLWRLAESLLPAAQVGAYIQAQMDLGATVCTRARPECGVCPLADSCLALCHGRVAVLPQARPRQRLPQREVRLLLLVDADRVLLLRRPPVGIWGGLTSLPELPADADAQVYALQVLGCEVANWREAPMLAHTFTHFRLSMRPLLGQVRRLTAIADAAGAVWLRRDALAEAALPAPIRVLLQRHF